MDFKRGIISNVMDILLPLAAIITLIFLITIIRINIEAEQKIVQQSFYQITESIIEKTCDSDCFQSSTIPILTSINKIDAIDIYVYDEDMNMISPASDVQLDMVLDMSIGSELYDLVLNSVDGDLIEIYYKDGYDVWFHWIYVPVMDKEYLFIYGLDMSKLDYTFPHVLTYLATFIILAYALKTNFVDKMIYMKIMQGSQKRLIDNFSYRKYDDIYSSKREGGK